METASRTLERVVACQLAFLEENHECACPEAVKQDSNSSPPPASEDSSTSSAQVEQKVPEAVDWSILPLGAATEEELEEETEHLSKRIRSQPKTAPLRKIAAEFQNRDQGDRRPCRRFLVARTCEDALNALEKSGGKPTELFSAFEVWNAPSLVFMLPGVGDHYINMSAGLYEAFPEYRRLLDRCAEILLAETGEDIRTVLFDASKKGRPSPAEGGIDLRAMIAGRRSVEDEATSRLNRIHHTHPLLFAVEFSLAGLWESFGVRPAAMVGFSLGEFVAAALAGVFTLEDALRLVSGRAGLMQNLPEGRMLAIPLPEDAVRTRLTAGVEIAVVCTPETTVVTGPKEAVAVFEERLRDEGVLYRSLQVSRAFHSTAMKPAEAPFREMIADIRLHVPRIPLCSNLTGDWISEDQATDPEYWVRHAGARILFSDGLERLLEEPERVFLEVGPGQALGSFVFQHPRTESAGRVEVLATLRSVNDAREDAAFLLTTLGRLWLLGLDVRWPSLKT